MRLIILVCCILFNLSVVAQKTSIKYELNGRASNKDIEHSISTSKNPFAKFIGEWTLKNDDWTHNWGNGTETIKIPKHHTVSSEINTDNSLFSIIDGPEPNGHIFWSYNPVTKDVNHLSSFGTLRAGKGKGSIDENSNLKLKLSFEGEPKGTYRVYNYKWLSDDEYHMKSVQYNQNDEPTGLFYEGYFIRIKKSEPKQVREELSAILKLLDSNTIAIDKKIHVYANDVVHMAPNHKAITNKNDLSIYLKEQTKYGYSNMTHEIIDYEILDDIIIMQGQVIGKFYPKNGTQPLDFKTKNLFVFKRIDGTLKIWKVIYNMTEGEISDEIIRSEIVHHGNEIRSAFSEENLEKIKMLHHPDVIKALGYEDLKVGRAQVIEALQQTLNNYKLEFVKNEIENILIQKDLAIEQTKFSIKGTPKQGGKPFIFSGRTMVTYVRYADSPTGWATIREIIQVEN